MPGMPGRTLLHHVRALRRDIPIVLTSGYLESAPEEECVFLPKPYDGEALERAVLQALGKSVG
jgi:CheY-like chemotaxis protein